MNCHHLCGSDRVSAAVCSGDGYGVNARCNPGVEGLVSNGAVIPGEGDGCSGIEWFISG